MGGDLDVDWERISDPERLQALEDLELLDSPEEEVFDRLTKLASKIMGVPIGLISIIDRNRQFFKSQVGLPSPFAEKRETPLTHSFCKHVVGTGEPLIVKDSRQDDRLTGNLAIAELSVIAYVGVPLKSHQGKTLGSFCVIDDKPREWTESEIEIMKDLSQLAATEINLRYLAKEYHNKYLRMRGLEIHRDELVHMVVHDLRNPLSAFRAFCHIFARDEGVSEVSKEGLSIAAESIDSMSALISSILDVHKSNSRKLELEIHDVSVEDLFSDIQKEFELVVSSTGLNFKLQCKPNLPHVPMDRSKIKRVIANLLTNAIHHTPESGTVTLSCEEDAENNTVIISIRDNGLGISKSAINLLFIKFEQLKAKRVRGTSTGLGLPFAKKIVESHGGELFVESKLGEGSVFSFSLPLSSAVN